MKKLISIVLFLASVSSLAVEGREPTVRIFEDVSFGASKPAIRAAKRILRHKGFTVVEENSDYNLLVMTKTGFWSGAAIVLYDAKEDKAIFSTRRFEPTNGFLDRTYANVIARKLLRKLPAAERLNQEN